MENFGKNLKVRTSKLQDGLIEQANNDNFCFYSYNKEEKLTGVEKAPVKKHRAL